MSNDSPVFGNMTGTELTEVGGVQMDIAHTGCGRIKRAIYPPGYQWSRNMKPITGTEWCMHAHVGFIAHGRIRIEFPDGCKKDIVAPEIFVIEPGHDGKVLGDEPAVLIEFDFEGDTVKHFKLPERHQH